LFSVFDFGNMSRHCKTWTLAASLLGNRKGTVTQTAKGFTRLDQIASAGILKYALHSEAGITTGYKFHGRRPKSDLSPTPFRDIFSDLKVCFRFLALRAKTAKARSCPLENV